MFTQDSIKNLVDDGGKFVNGPNGMNLNWGMYTVADVCTLLEWHVEYSPSTRKQAKHILHWLTYHGVELSAYFYDAGFDEGPTPNINRVTRTNIENASLSMPLVDESGTEKHYCERTCHWLNRALLFLYNNPTPIVTH